LSLPVSPSFFSSGLVSSLPTVFLSLPNLGIVLLSLSVAFATDFGSFLSLVPSSAPIFFFTPTVL